MVTDKRFRRKKNASRSAFYLLGQCSPSMQEGLVKNSLKLN